MLSDLEIMQAEELIKMAQNGDEENFKALFNQCLRCAERNCMPAPPFPPVGINTLYQSILPMWNPFAYNQTRGG